MKTSRKMQAKERRMFTMIFMNKLGLYK